ncbi:fasciclin domain-containing protein, partial [Sphaerisporangium sp. NPDC049002]
MKTRILAVPALAVAFSLTAACGGGSTSAEPEAASAAPATTSAAPAPADTPMATPSGGPFGAACSAVPSSGAGSFDGMAQDPVA